MAISTITGVSTGSTGTVITTGSSGQVIPKAALPTGSVLQVVVGTKTSSTFTTSSTYSSTGLFATITPTSSSSKILVTATSHNFYPAPGFITVQLWRGTSGEGSGSNLTVVLRSNQSQNYIPGGFTYYDSPASTSALTYTVMQKSDSNSQLVGFIGDATSSGVGTSTITLMEIAA